MWDVTGIKTGSWTQPRETWLWTFIQVPAGWPAVQVCCRNVIGLPTFFPSGDKETFNHIKIHINRNTQRPVSFLQTDKRPDSHCSDTRAPQQRKMSQNGRWFIWVTHRHFGLNTYVFIYTVSPAWHSAETTVFKGCLTNTKVTHI